jgi:hypothetical protein
MSGRGRRISGILAVALWALTVFCCGASARAEAPRINETRLVAMLDEVLKYYDDARPYEGQLLTLLPAYEKNKDSAEYRKLRFLFDTHQKVTTSLNNLIDVLYIYLKLGNDRDQDLNDYIYNRSKNIITFLNNMVYFLTARNQEIELGASTDVQKLYETYLVRLTTLMYELNKELEQFHR